MLSRQTCELAKRFRIEMDDRHFNRDVKDLTSEIVKEESYSMKNATAPECENLHTFVCKYKKDKVTNELYPEITAK